jgi:flagellar basal-body rod protein FlgF
MDIGLNMAAYMGVRATRELGMVSQNLANASTRGFKRELFNNWQVAPPTPTLNGDVEGPFYVDVVSRDLGQGSLHETGSETDLALQGPGFFKVQTPRGIRYTRDGGFSLNAEYQLVTVEGHPVMGKNGPLTLDSRDKRFGFDQEGGIHMDKNLSDQIVVVNFPNPQELLPEGHNLLVAGPRAGEEVDAENTQVLQGNIEMSNVDLVTESVALIDLNRRYESYLKLLETFVTADRKVVEEIGQKV